MPMLDKIVTTVLIMLNILLRSISPPPNKDRFPQRFTKGGLPICFKHYSGDGERWYAPLVIPLMMPTAGDLKLTHDTGRLDNQVVRITLEGGFVGGRNVIRDFDDKPGGENVTLCWWNMSLHDNWEAEVTEWPEQNAEWIPCLEEAPILSERSMYGNYRFAVTQKDLVDSYEQNMECRASFRKYATVFYTREVMYTVLVCPEDHQLFTEFPTMDQSLTPHEALGIMKGCDTWVYNPSCWIQYDKCSKEPLAWDHVCFAFYLPEGKHLPVPTHAPFTVLEKVDRPINEADTPWMTKQQAAKELVGKFMDKEVDILENHNNPVLRNIKEGLVVHLQASSR